jgi:F0F1-type ATP synthase membrane subunit b/b'
MKRLNLMALFTERMEAIVNELLNAHSHREADVTRIKVETGQVLTDAQTRLSQISDETRVEAEELREQLSSDRQEQADQVNALREKTRADLANASDELREELASNRQERTDHVNALREKNRADIASSTDELREELAKQVADRQDDVCVLLSGFSQVQQALAADLKGAALSWNVVRGGVKAPVVTHGHHTAKGGRGEPAPKKSHRG